MGSGFGGSVTAYRLAEAGRSTVVLERGQVYPPGSFPRNPYEMSRAFWEPKDNLFGLFDIRSFRKIEAIVASGLGGGSLIYANVLLRKDERWFVHDSPLPGGGYENWPISREDLEPHYDAVAEMLQPVPLPYPDLPKSRAIREAAQTIGLEAFHPPLAVTFAPPGGDAAPKQVIPEPSYGNIHGLTRLTCRLCGECDIGCNEGSKNTMDHTYLSAAQHHGADIRTLAEVTAIEPLDGAGFEVTYVQYGEAGEDHQRSRTQHRVRCANVFLGAGSLGTTALLLRNRVHLSGLGRALGTRFSGNGDLLTFAMGARNGGTGGESRLIDGSYGPVITTAVRVADELDGHGVGRGYYVQEAGFPEFANWLIETTQLTASFRRSSATIWELLKHRLGPRFESTVSAEVARLVGDGRLGSSALPLLGMGRDTPDGKISLRDGELDIEWTSATSMSFFSAMRSTMRSLSDALNATYHDNPLWWTKRVVTVHPLGGSPMGRNIQEGVVDAYGECFGQPGLFVVDGAAMPGPVGANPSFTIAALANRTADHFLSRPKLGAPAVGAHSMPEPALSTELESGRSVRFTEQMKGYVALSEKDTIAGWEQGRQLGHRFMFELTITIPDVDSFVSAAEHPGTAEGYVRYEPLGGQFEVERGWFNLFVPVDGAVGDRQMRYRLWFRDLSGAPVTLYGYKDVHDDHGLDIWRDTSTLYVTLLEGHAKPGDEAEVLGAGLLRILPLDFAKQLFTFRAAGGGSAGSLASFMSFFARSLRDVYLRPRPKSHSDG